MDKFVFYCFWLVGNGSEVNFFYLLFVELFIEVGQGIFRVGEEYDFVCWMVQLVYQFQFGFVVDFIQLVYGFVFGFVGCDWQFGGFVEGDKLIVFVEYEFIDVEFRLWYWLLFFVQCCFW